MSIELVTLDGDVMEQATAIAELCLLYTSGASTDWGYVPSVHSRGGIATGMRGDELVVMPLTALGARIVEAVEPFPLGAAS